MTSGPLTRAELKAIDEYLDFATVEAGGAVASSFVALVRDAREASGRDLITGHLDDVDKAGSWLGALGWLCLFDQIGQTVSASAPKGGKPLRAGARFKACLADFGNGVSKSDCNYLWLLRNSLGHSYSLQAENGKDQSPFKFVLDSSDTLALVTRRSTNDSVIVVNLREVGGLGETVVAAILAARQRNTLRLRATPKVLRNRYFLQVGGVVKAVQINSSSTAVTGIFKPEESAPAPSAGSSASVFPPR